MIDTYPTPPHGWTCFHCGITFEPTMAGQRMAQQHFGKRPTQDTMCRDRPDYESLLRRLRRAENENWRQFEERQKLEKQLAAIKASPATVDCAYGPK